MLKKIVGLGLVCLFLAVSFVVAEDDIGSYNPIADVTRDGTVDILDLVEVGQAYGSNYILMHQTNKTTVTVLSFENGNLSFIENSLVAVFPQSTLMEGLWNYTDSSGVATFDLGANSSYIAISWDDTRSRYNYVNFTTNSLGEASVAICLDYWPTLSQSPHPVRMIPRGWIVMTFFDNNTGEPYIYGELTCVATSFTLQNTPEQVIWTSGRYPFLTYTGIFAWDSFESSLPYTKPNTSVCLDFWIYDIGRWVGNCTYRTDEYGGAYVVATIYRYW